jgi:hypothetical protein
VTSRRHTTDMPRAPSAEPGDRFGWSLGAIGLVVKKGSPSGVALRSSHVESPCTLKGL